MGSEVMLGRPLGGPLGGALGLRPAATAPAVAGALPVDVLLVGGGGAGDIGNPSINQDGMPGGGAGQVIQATLWLPPGVYPATIGLGGSLGGQGAPADRAGGDTVFAGLRALGGGNGFTFGIWGVVRFASGASTGGHPSGRAITGFPGTSNGEGEDPGTGNPFNFGGSGGGSAGPGLAGNNNVRALGGPGVVSSISGAPVEYARGGHGTLNNDTAPERSSPGWGDGGGGKTAPFGVSSGRAGILILSYPTGTQTWLGGDVTQAGNRTIHTLTANGTLTRTA
jgi:hypothetical protein